MKVCYVTWCPGAQNVSAKVICITTCHHSTVILCSMNYESGSSHGARQKLLGKFVYLLVSDRFEHGFLLKTVFAACDIL